MTGNPMSAVIALLEPQSEVVLERIITRAILSALRSEGKVLFVAEALFP
jgi:hypothetical protein